MKIKGSLIFIIIVLIFASVYSKNSAILLADASGTFFQPLYFELAESFSFESYYISLHLKPDGTFVEIDACIDLRRPSGTRSGAEGKGLERSYKRYLCVQRRLS